MKRLTQTIRRSLGAVGRLLGHVAAAIIGSVIIAVGLGMMVTVVMLPVGILTSLLGILVVLGGLFAGDDLDRAAE